MNFVQSLFVKSALKSVLFRNTDGIFFLFLYKSVKTAAASYWMLLLFSLFRISLNVKDICEVPDWIADDEMQRKVVFKCNR